MVALLSLKLPSSPWEIWGERHFFYAGHFRPFCTLASCRKALLWWQIMRKKVTCESEEAISWFRKFKKILLFPCEESSSFLSHWYLVMSIIQKTIPQINDEDLQWCKECVIKISLTLWFQYFIKKIMVSGYSYLEVFTLSFLVVLISRRFITWNNKE